VSPDRQDVVESIDVGGPDGVGLDQPKARSPGRRSSVVR
jgi:hypothetical protein